MPSDTEVQQLVIYVGTQAQIEAEKAEGHITNDDFVVVTDGPQYQPLLTAQNAGTGIAITTEGGVVKISNTQTSAIWGNVLGNLPDQYDLNQALEGKQPVILDLSTIRDGAALGATALQVSDIINAVNSSAIDKALSAAMGKALQDQIDNLKSRGRFLSVWNTSTGLPTTNPEESPYNYRAGDYYIVGTVASGGTNYRPNGSTYVIGVASTTVESAEVNKGDTYIYDGSEWLLQSDTQKTLAFANIAGDPYDNTNLASALNAKQNELTQGTGITITGTTISNAGVRSVSSGATNGTISVNTNGTSEEVSVHGLGTAAFTSTTDYATAAQGSKADSAVQDVQVNGTTVTTSGVANIPKAASNTLGTIMIGSGLAIQSSGSVYVVAATESNLINKLNSSNPVVSTNLNIAIREGLGNNNLTWTDAYKLSACKTIGTISGVQINSTDLTPDATTNKVNIPKAGAGTLGVVSTNNNYGVSVNNNGQMYITAPTDAQVTAKALSTMAVTCSKIDLATKVGVTTNTIALTTSEQASACSWLGASQVEFVDWE